MNRTLVWDLPIRLIHWGLAGSLTASLGIALLVDDDHPAFQVHMLLGLVALFLVVVRVVIGLVGSRHARFRHFPLRPLEIGRYFAAVVRGRGVTYAGNNPGSALAALAIFALVILLAVTGVGGGEPFEDVHEVLAYTLAGVIGAHLVGILVHTVQHRENIAVSMITGRKDRPDADGIGSAHPWWGAAVLAVCVAWTIGLFAGHNPEAASVRLPLIGAVVSLGERERETPAGGHGRSREHHGRERDHDDDD